MMTIETLKAFFEDYEVEHSVEDVLLLLNECNGSFEKMLCTMYENEYMEIDDVIAYCDYMGYEDYRPNDSYSINELLEYWTAFDIVEGLAHYDNRDKWVHITDSGFIETCDSDVILETYGNDCASWKYYRDFEGIEELQKLEHLEDEIMEVYEKC